MNFPPQLQQLSSHFPRRKPLVSFLRKNLFKIVIKFVAEFLGIGQPLLGIIIFLSNWLFRADSANADPLDSDPGDSPSNLISNLFAHLRP